MRQEITSLMKTWYNSHFIVPLNCTFLKFAQRWPTKRPFAGSLWCVIYTGKLRTGLAHQAKFHLVKHLCPKTPVTSCERLWVSWPNNQSIGHSFKRRWCKKEENWHDGKKFTKMLPVENGSLLSICWLFFDLLWSLKIIP